MRRQIDRDFGAWSAQGRNAWTEPAAEWAALLEQLPPTRQKELCNFEIYSPTAYRHCNFTAKGLHERFNFRAKVLARAMTVLAARAELPAAQSGVVSFPFFFSDVEWEDLPVPVVTFQRGVKCKKVVRIPMWEQLDGGWSRKVEQDVVSHSDVLPFERKWHRSAFWRGTDSAVPGLNECNSNLHLSCSVTTDNIHLFHRLQLVRYSLALPHRIDARLSGVKPQTRAIGLHHMYKASVGVEQALGFLEHHGAREWTIEEQLHR
eukprot:2604160-Amphidinium_carterae.1